MRLPLWFQKFRKELIFLGILVVTASGVLIGSGVAYRVGAVASSRYEKLEVLAKVLYLVEKNYVNEVDEKDLIYGAINGMLATLDPHSTFLPPNTYKEMQVETQGKFSGIGIEITMQQDKGLTVVSPIEDTPAFRGGLHAGDQILSIDGTSTKDLSLPQAVTKMRGPKGSKVKLLIFREGFKEPKEFVIVRDTIRIQSVKYRTLEPGYGYVRVTNFQERTNYDLNKALDALQAKPGGIRGLVLDMRNNPGGLLDQAVQVADTFLVSGKIVTTRGRNRREIKTEEAQARGTREDFPMIVLVNGGSASASEIVAGALQDHKRAVILGTQTFGKGTVQTLINLDDGSGLKLTIARYFTPNDRDIQEKGIVPDIKVEPRAAADKKAEKARRYLREKDLKGHLRNMESGGETSTPETEAVEPEEDAADAAPDGNKELSINDDLQLKTALDYLKTWDVFKIHEMNVVKQAGVVSQGN